MFNCTVHAALSYVPGSKSLQGRLDDSGTLPTDGYSHRVRVFAAEKVDYSYS